MNEDFIRALHDDLVEAMDRYERRSPARRTATALQPVLRPTSLIRAATVAALLILALVLALDLATERSPAQPRVVAIVPIGGMPIDAAVVHGSLWATDSTGAIVGVDPAAHRVISRIPVPGSPSAIAGAAGGLWVQTSGTDCRGRLIRVDPRSRRIVGSVQLPYPSERLGALAGARGGAVWVKRGFCSWRQEIDRVVPAGEVTARLALTNADGLATTPRTLSALDHDGTLTQIDAADGRIQKRWPGLAPLADPNTWNTKALVSDEAGVWLLSTGRATILRIEDGRIVQRLAAVAHGLPLLTHARDGLWTATGDRLGANYRLIRIDPMTGRQTATVKLGTQQPVALTPSGEQLCVLTSNGKILIIQA
jgi:hypothetical protein